MSTLIVIAKEPVPGRVKTRLSPPFTPEQAAALASAALEDTLQAALETGTDHRLLVLQGRPLPRWGRAFTVVPQVEGSLDRRLAAAFQAAAARDPGPVLLVGMDTPQVTPALLRQSLPADGEDATLGPAHDGGFWCLGLRRPRECDLPALLVGVPMSTDHTGADQRRRLVGAGLRVRTLPTLRDVDTADDAETVAALAPSTRFCAELDGLRAGVRTPASRR
jgi:rSAM/selenodomain-associated transferase 1